jgi:uncharacterized alkaline shock family protein YloU
MTQSSMVTRAGGAVSAGGAERGTTRIADNVVAKIAGYAAREIPGVQSMGSGAGAGVAVEVGERRATIDLDLVTYYGQSIVEITEAVRANVIERIEGMTGLEVSEVNITVDDLFVEGDDAER